MLFEFGLESFDTWSIYHMWGKTIPRVYHPNNKPTSPHFGVDIFPLLQLPIITSGTSIFFKLEEPLIIELF